MGRSWCQGHVGRELVSARPQCPGDRDGDGDRQQEWQSHEELGRNRAEVRHGSGDDLVERRVIQIDRIPIVALELEGPIIERLDDAVHHQRGVTGGGVRPLVDRDVADPEVVTRPGIEEITAVIVRFHRLAADHDEHGRSAEPSRPDHDHQDDQQRKRQHCRQQCGRQQRTTTQTGPHAESRWKSSQRESPS